MNRARKGNVTALAGKFSAWIRPDALQRICETKLGTAGRLITRTREICEEFGGRNGSARSGTGQISPVQSTLKYWRAEYEVLIEEAEALKGSRKEIPVLSLS